MVSVDPGDPHVGVAVWSRSSVDAVEWQLETAVETTPNAFLDDLFDRCQKSQGGFVVAYERFLLRGGRAALAQTGSELGVVQTIGALKWIARACSTEVIGVTPSERASARARMRGVGFPFPRGATDHARDAAAVGAYAVGWSATWSTLAPEARL